MSGSNRTHVTVKDKNCFCRIKRSKKDKCMYVCGSLSAHVKQNDSIGVTGGLRLSSVNYSCPSRGPLSLALVCVCLKWPHAVTALKVN